MNYPQSKSRKGKGLLKSCGKFRDTQAQATRLKQDSDLPDAGLTDGQMAETHREVNP